MKNRTADNTFLSRFFHLIPVIFLAFAIFLFLTGCHDSDHNDSALTGILVDGPVSGVSYETPKFSGVTATDGGFRYKKGETVTFRLGDTLLGTAPGKAEVSVFDLQGDGTIPVTLSDIPELRTSPLADFPDNSYRAGINLAVLVQSLDQDNMVENGIEIHPQTAALFDGVQLDFDQSYTEFCRDPAVKVLLGAANSEIFTVRRPLKNMYLALDHLYDGLDVAPSLFAKTAEQTDRNNDGLADERVSVSCDKNENSVRAEKDFQGDGIPDRVWDCWYDGNGNRIREIFDPYADGNPAEITTWQYDENGSLIREEIDPNDGGNPEYSAWERDANGDWTRNETDWDRDGIPDLIRIQKHDEKGRLVYDATDRDGAIENIVIYRYDDQNQIRREEFDNDGDGNPDRIQIRQFAENGNLLHYEAHIFESELPYFYIADYNENGDFTRKTYDIDGDGALDRIVTRDYDAGGNVTREADDTDNDGNPDATITWQYDHQGNRIREEKDENGDGQADKIYAWQFDTNGNMLQEAIDEDGDGIPEKINVRHYDENGNLIREEKDENGEGQADKIYTWQFDENGNLIREAKDENGDGFFETVTTKNYTPVSSWWELYLLDAGWAMAF